MRIPTDEIIYAFEDFHLDVSRKLLFRVPEGEAEALTRKAFEVLLLLVENHGSLVTKDDLMTKVWVDSIVEDANLTQTVSVLRRILGENPNEHRFIVTETGKGYRFVAQVEKLNGNRLVQETGLDAEDSFKRSKPGVSRPQRNFLLAFAALTAVVLIVGGYYLWTQWQTQPSQTITAKEVKSIAVLPFRNVESDKENRVLGIGMADAVITKLSQIKSIVVRQLSTVIRYADSTPEAIKVGREINVDAVLEGNIQQADGRIRVSVRLYSVSDGTLLWAENFYEQEANIFAIQESIAEKVANSLSLELHPDERRNLTRRYTENIEAYNLYNKGRLFWNNRTGADLQKSIEHYQKALALDENYALAYSGLAESYVLLQFYSQTRNSEHLPKARQAAEKALSLDPNLGEAHTALALYRQQYEWDWEGAEIEFKRAISNNPNYATAHQWYGEMLAMLGRTEESIAKLEKAVELDPLSRSGNTAKAVPYMAAGRFDEAIEKLKLALELDASFPVALLYLGDSYDGAGNHKEAVAQYQKCLASPFGGGPYTSASLLNVLAKDGQLKEAERNLAGILKRSEKNPVSNYVLARAFAAIGDKEKAFENLDQAFQQRDGLLLNLKTDRNFVQIRNETRFQEILRKMRL